VSHELLSELGYRIVIFPISTLLAATASIRSVLHRIKADGSPAGVLPGLMPFNAFLDFIGTPEIGELEQRFASPSGESRRD
jgi:2-methylisocitrate lyase-like PEP mutase family enzyme